MKIFLSEYRHDYNTYTFGYTIYCVYEYRSELDEIYTKGFLPYTGDLGLKYDLFYKSRGIRIRLSDFRDSSENRRVNRKMEPLGITYEMIPVESYAAMDQFAEFARKYSEERIGEDKMPLQRINYILGRKYLTHILPFTSGGLIVGYVLAVVTDRHFHYWFSFYDTRYLDQNKPLGKWLMWKCIHIARELGKEYIYLGNGYLEKSLYKTRDFKSVEFYEGNTWSSDVKRLQQLCLSDPVLTDLDAFKLSDKRNEWIAAVMASK